MPDGFRAVRLGRQTLERQLAARLASDVANSEVIGLQIARNEALRALQACADASEPESLSLVRQELNVVAALADRRAPIAAHADTLQRLAASWAQLSELDHAARVQQLATCIQNADRDPGQALAALHLLGPGALRAAPASLTVAPDSSSRVQQVGTEAHQTSEPVSTNARLPVPPALAVGGLAALLVITAGVAATKSSLLGGSTVSVDPGSTDPDMALLTTTGDTIVEDEVHEAPTARSQPAPPVAVLAKGTLSEVALAWRARTTEPAASAYRVVGAGGRYELRASAAGAPNALQPALVLPDPAVNIRAQPSTDGRFLRTMPPGTLAVALYGVVDGQPSVAGGKGTWTYLVASSNTSGWSSSSLLGPARGCVPDPSALVASLPSEARAAASTDAMLAKSSLDVGGRATQVVTLLARDAGAERSFVRVHALDASCAVTSSVAAHTLPGVLEHTFTMNAVDGAGPGLLAIGWKAPAAGPDDRTQWDVYELGSSRPVYSTQLVSDPRAMRSSDGLRGAVSRGPRGKRGYWPLRVLRDDKKEFYRWEGNTLVLDE